MRQHRTGPETLTTACFTRMHGVPCSRIVRATVPRTSIGRAQMADETPPLPDTPPAPPPPTSASPFSRWMANSGLAGKLLGFGGAGGALLLLIVLIAYGGMIWQGILALISYVAAAGTSWFIYQGPSQQRKTCVMVVLGAAAIAGLFGLWLLILGLQTIMPFWILLNVVAAGAVVAGAVMASKAERIF